MTPFFWTSTQELESDIANVQIWFMSLARPHDELASLLHLLSRAELEERTRFMNPVLQTRYTVTRALTRQVLGRSLGVDPADVRLLRDDNGRPELDPIFGRDISFNLSHTGDALMLGMVEGQDVQIGVDIEVRRETVDYLLVAQRFFSTYERDLVAQASSPSERERLFFQIWTAKESLIKAVGMGISFGLNLFSLHPDGQCEVPLVQMNRQPFCCGQFDIRDVSEEALRLLPDDGCRYAAACALFHRDG